MRTKIERDLLVFLIGAVQGPRIILIRHMVRRILPLQRQSNNILNKLVPVRHRSLISALSAIHTPIRIIPTLLFMIFNEFLLALAPLA